MNPITELIAAAKEIVHAWDMCEIDLNDQIVKLETARAAAEAFMEPVEMVVSGERMTHWYSCPVCHSPVGPGYNCCPDCQKPLKRPA